MSAGGFDDPGLDVGARVGRWQIVRRIGIGGTASVYEAIHADLGRRAALKVLHERLFLDGETRTRFVREGRAAARLLHPHLVPVHDAGLDEGRAFLVMELLEGETLADRLSREGPCSATLCAELMLPIVAALGAVHDAGIVHRDIKPGNIFLERDGEAVRPRLLDFGTSRFVDSHDDVALTRTRALLGTPAYMSPEQAEGARDVDARSDQFAIGAVLYECISGRRPFDAATWQRTLVALLHDDAVPLRTVAADCPPALERVVARAMARRPDDRFDDVRALGAALAAACGDAALEQWSALLRGLPTSAAKARRPSPARRRFARWTIAISSVAASVAVSMALVRVLPHTHQAQPRVGTELLATTSAPRPSPALVPPPQPVPLAQPAPIALRTADAGTLSARRPTARRTSTPLRAISPITTAQSVAVAEPIPAAAPDVAAVRSDTASAVDPTTSRVLGRGANHALILAH